MEIGIVVVAYNRKDSMLRLLRSLESANYANDSVPLIISIDKSNSDSVELAAKEFVWSHGEKRVIKYTERQGLRKHVLNCGSLLNEFDAVIILEDDIFVAPSFYLYAKATTKFYYDDSRIAGISLYSHLWNQHVDQPFEPTASSYDNYFIQYAASWGQVWMKNQWNEFFSWYHINCGEFEEDDTIPDDVRNWPVTSWLKYHIKYCVKNDKYFVYPYTSLSTCFCDAGEHFKKKDTHYQVPLNRGICSEYKLLNLNDSEAVIYDAFFERVFPEGTIIGIPAKDISVDLYGSRKGYSGKRYVLSTLPLPYRSIMNYGMELKPHEQNILLDIAGDYIHLYDTMTEDKCPPDRSVDIFRYRFRLYENTKLCIRSILMKIKARIFNN